MPCFRSTLATSFQFIRKAGLAAVVFCAALVCALQPAFAQFVQQGPKLAGSGAVGLSNQGASVALSSDGNTAIVGGPLDNSQTGAAWVFKRSGAIWSQQAELNGSQAVGSAEQGASVSLSGNGQTAIVGGPSDNSHSGAAWIWGRRLIQAHVAWALEAKVVGTGATGAAAQGSSVAFSADGNTAIVGAPGDASGIGAAWIFTRGSNGWPQQGAKLVGMTLGQADSALQGTAVALSADGSTAIVGGGLDHNGIGAAWVFVRSGSTWTQQGPKLIGSGVAGSASNQGASVALSADGNTAVVGGPADNSNTGATWVWTRSGGVWAQQGSKLVGTGAVGVGFQGNSVGLSADGDTAALGGYLDNAGAGAVWIFRRNGSVWTQQGAKIIGTGATRANPLLGVSVALSSDGNTMMAGGPQDNSNIGSTWVFVAPPTVTAISPASGPVTGGTSVTVTGTNLTGATAVNFGPNAAPTFTVNSAASITTTSPPGSGQVQVTVTTTAGTSALSGDDAYTYNPVVTHDFNGDGLSDILWRHSNGSMSTWQMAANGTHTAFSFGVVPTAWQIAGTNSLVASTGDVDSDGKADIFWRNTNGSLSLWEMKGGTAHTPISLGTVATAWRIVGVGDFDGDGHADILWRHTNGSLSIWKMAANGSHTALNFGVVPTAWQVAGISDVTGDGKADIVWRNTNGSLSIWAMNGGTSHTVLNLGVVAVAWQIAGVGDFDGDGKADLFWRNTNGSLSIWKMAANGSHTAVSLGSVATAWHIASIGDYNGDGRADILWRNTNGAALIWTMNANGTHAAVNLGTVATAWTIVE